MKRKPTNKLTALLFLPLIVVGLLFVSCEKKWKQTAPMTVKFALAEQDANDSLLFTDCALVLQSLSFTGSRKQSSGVYFKDQLSNVEIGLHPGSPVTLTSYDIPQGTYKTMDFVVVSADRTPSPSLKLTGQYLMMAGEKIKVVFEFDPAQVMNAYAISATSAVHEVNVLEGSPVIATLVFDPKYLFAAVNLNMLHQSSIQSINGTLTTIINSETNVDLYKLIVPRISEQLKVMIKN